MNGSIYEYDEEAHFRQVYQEGYEQGKSEVETLTSILIETGRFDDLKRVASDIKYMKKLINELLPEEMTGNPYGHGLFF